MVPALDMGLGSSCHSAGNVVSPQSVPITIMVIIITIIIATFWLLLYIYLQGAEDSHD